MAVFRIEKTRDYTVMSNHHLRDKSLSLKAKGLLSLMLSLPEEWDYTTKGLARICKDGVDSICAGVRELEEHGYGEWKTGAKVEGLTMSTISIGQKLGAAIGGTLAPALLAAVSYDPDLAIQPQNVLNLFTAEMIWIPAAVYTVVAGILLYITKLEKKIPQMKAEIAARNAAEK